MYVVPWPCIAAAKAQEEVLSCVLLRVLRDTGDYPDMILTALQVMMMTPVCRVDCLTGSFRTRLKHYLQIHFQSHPQVNQMTGNTSPPAVFSTYTKAIFMCHYRLGEPKESTLSARKKPCTPISTFLQKDSQHSRARPSHKVHTIFPCQ